MTSTDFKFNDRVRLKPDWLGGQLWKKLHDGSDRTGQIYFIDPVIPWASVKWDDGGVLWCALEHLEVIGEETET